MPVDLPDQPFISFQRSLCDHNPAILNDPFRHTDDLVLFAKLLKESYLFVLQRHYLISRADQFRQTDHLFKPEIQLLLLLTDKKYISREQDFFLFMPFPVISFHLFTVRDKTSFQYIFFYHPLALLPDLFLCPGFYLYYIPHAHPSVHCLGQKGYASPFRLPFRTQIICQ